MQSILALLKNESLPLEDCIEAAEKILEKAKRELEELNRLFGRLKNSGFKPGEKRYEQVQGKVNRKEGEVELLAEALSNLKAQREDGIALQVIRYKHTGKWYDKQSITIPQMMPWSDKFEPAIREEANISEGMYHIVRNHPEEGTQEDVFIDQLYEPGEL